MRLFVFGLVSFGHMRTSPDAQEQSKWARTLGLGLVPSQPWRRSSAVKMEMTKTNGLDMFYQAGELLAWSNSTIVCGWSGEQSLHQFLQEVGSSSLWMNRSKYVCYDNHRDIINPHKVAHDWEEVSCLETEKSTVQKKRRGFRGLLQANRAEMTIDHLWLKK